MHIAETTNRFRPAGVAGALWTAISRRLLAGSAAGADARRQLRVLESISLGPKKQLFLVGCGAERFLVGTGADSVQSMVRVGDLRPHHFEPDQPGPDQAGAGQAR